MGVTICDVKGWGKLARLCEIGVGGEMSVLGMALSERESSLVMRDVYRG